MTDITERKRAEKKLQESEETYRTIFENTGTPAALIEEDTVISYVNGNSNTSLDIPSRKLKEIRNGQNL